MKTIVTAEIGVNHNGNFDTLIELLKMVHKVQIVTESKVLIKLQKRDPSKYSTISYNSWILNRMVPYREHKRALELNREQFIEFDEYCLKYGVEWYCSPFDLDSLKFLTDNFSHLKYWKVASPVTTDQPNLIAAICEQPGLKFMSTGMCSLEELDFAVLTALKHCSETDLILMHCTSMYPTPINHVNLAVMDTLRSRYGLRIGYSSHDAGVPISVAAVALGAVAIEKHITCNHTLPGPDHALSLEYRGLETLVKHIQAIEDALGSAQKQYYVEEENVRNKVRITS